MAPLEIIHQVVRAAAEHRLVTPQIKHHGDCPVPSLGAYLLPESLVVIEVDLGVGQSVRF